MTSSPVSRLPVRRLPGHQLPAQLSPDQPPLAQPSPAHSSPNHRLNGTRRADLSPAAGGRRNAATRSVLHSFRPSAFWTSGFWPFALILFVSVLLVVLTAEFLSDGGPSKSGPAVQSQLWLSRLWLPAGLLAGMLGLWWQTRRLIHRQARDFGLARSDELTGLPNRRALNEHLQTLLNATATRTRSIRGRGSAPERGRQGWSVLLIDIDFFKAVNDTYGHLAGDEVLRALTACLRQELRADDLPGRWGGEEFLALLPATGFEGALVAAERLRQAVSLQTFPYAGRLTVSVGVAACRPGDQLERVVARADAGMYVAKQRGRNRVAFSE